MVLVLIPRTFAPSLARHASETAADLVKHATDRFLLLSVRFFDRSVQLCRRITSSSGDSGGKLNGRQP